jgi:broad-specificity NMP kinase
MIVLINGSFGVGKTTIAKLLRRRLPGSVIYDPEWAGVALMRSAKWISYQGSGTDDFQDIHLWRRLTIAGSKLSRRLFSGPVIVPMTFTDRVYFDEVLSGLNQVDPDVKVFCLQATLSTIKQRLAQRGTDNDARAANWVARRIMDCAEAHRDPHFGEPVETDYRPPNEIAADIEAKLISFGTKRPPRAN